MKRKVWIARGATALLAAATLAVAFPAAAFADEGDGSLNDSMDYSQSDPVPSVDPALDLPYSVNWVDPSDLG
jgi:hypothetical protein